MFTKYPLFKNIVKVIICSLTALGTLSVYAQDKLSIALARNTITPAEEIFVYAVPKHKGYFAAENISPEILKSNGSMAAIQLVSSGKAQIGFASSVNIASAIEKGVPIKAFAGLTVKWPYQIAVLEGSPLKQVSDLKGKKVGVISLASASFADLKASLHYAGLEEQDVKIIPVGAGIQAATALSRGQINAIVSYSDSFERMQQHGFNLTFLPRAKEMEALFSVTMFTNTKTLKEQPELLRKFVKAAYKGIIYTHLYPDSALEMGFKEFPELAGSKDSGSKEAQTTKKVMLVALGDSIPSGQPNPAQWGSWLDIGSARWEALLNFAYQTQQLQYPLKPEQVWDGSLMKDVFNFDIRQITQ